MSRRKTPAVKLTSAPCKVPPPLSQVLLRRWFTNKENWEEFQNFYSKMPILKPRYLSEGLQLEDKYPVFWRCKVIWLVQVLMRQIFSRFATIRQVHRIK
ncbi:hypothetical protein PIB30_095814 [Stylosanthes scabra]|uniref:Uncharacterized protein n=1 Tax=Stylosanthes scabra TaxID=79078 RepID=A0ABU6QV64_9FABA|nr:hypothetical protein [Stylosanthes scabra]